MAKPQVFIPVVLKKKPQVQTKSPAKPEAEASEGGGEPRKLPEVWLWPVGCRSADPQEKLHTIQLVKDNKEPTIDLLGKLGRYDSAWKGLFAVRRWLGEYGLNVKNLETQLLDRRLVSLDAEKKAKDIEDDSSDLGLGLALLLDLVNAKPVKVIAATGELGPAAKADANDLPVLPVGNITEKLKVLLKNKQQGEGALGQLGLVFTPMQYEAAPGVLAPVSGLPIVQKLEREGIAVIPVKTFGQAAQALGIKPKFPWRRWLTVGLSVLALWVGISAKQLHDQPATLEKLPPPLEQATDPDPYLVCLDAKGQPDSPHPIAKSDGVNTVPVASHLAWQVRVGRPEEAEHWLAKTLQWLGYRDPRYYVAVVMIGKTSGIQARSVLIPKLSARETVPARVNPGGIWRYHIPLNDTVEDSLLMILANQSREFNPGALQKALEDQFSSQAGKLDFESVKHFLENNADATLSFDFQASGQETACPPH